MAQRRSESKKSRPARVRLDTERLKAVLAQRRQELGWSLRELAERSGVSSSAVHALEQGNTRAQLDNFVSVLAALDLRPDEVLVVDASAPPQHRSALQAELESIRAIKDPGEAMLRLAALLDRRDP